MSLSMLTLAVFVLLEGLMYLGWVAVSPVLLGILGLVAGILLILEGLSVFNHRFGGRA